MHEQQSGRPLYCIPIVDSAPRWGEIPILRLSNWLWRSGYAPETTAAMAYAPGAGFYVRMTCAEASPRAANRAEDDPVWEDSCLECFLNFAPEMGDGYINLECNAAGALLCEYGAGRAGRVRLSALTAPRPTAHAARSAGDWSVEFFIPLATVEGLFRRTDFQPGDRLRGNFYKCGDCTAQPHFGAWAQIESETPDFHRPAFFGTLVIGGEAPVEDDSKDGRG